MGSTQSSEPTAQPAHRYNLDGEYSPSEDDVAAVRSAFVMLLGIPPEIFAIIADMAAYWPSLQSTRYLNVKIPTLPRRGSPFPMAEWCCLVSPPVPESARFIRAITIRTESRDQGWGGEPEDRGTRNGSWTWFEAMIVRGEPWWLSCTADEYGLLPVDLYHEGERQSVHDRRLATTCEVAHPTLGRTRWHVTANVTAKKEYTEHTARWTPSDETYSGDDENDSDSRHAKGISGRQADFVKLIEPGDRVALLAMAKVCKQLKEERVPDYFQFPMWTNNIREVALEILYSV